MTSKTHITTGCLATVTLCHTLHIPLLPSVLGAVIGSTLPDKDQSISFLRHRGQTHSILASALIYLAYIMTNEPCIMGVAVGYMTHIAFDMLNGSGVELFYPSKINYRILDIKYDGIAEAIIFYLSIGGGAIWALKYLLQYRL